MRASIMRVVLLVTAQLPIDRTGLCLDACQLFSTMCGDNINKSIQFGYFLANNKWNRHAWNECFNKNEILMVDMTASQYGVNGVIISPLSALRTRYLYQVERDNPQDYIGLPDMTKPFDGA